MTEAGKAASRPLIACLFFMLIVLTNPTVQNAGLARSMWRQASRAALRKHNLALHHVFIVILENREYKPSAGPPYLKELRRQGALATRSYGVSHPSLPNYLALLSGTTSGITDDCTDCRARGTTVVDQLERRHLSWKAYMESMPHACFSGAGRGLYVKKHNPFMYFRSITGVPSRCRRVQPLRSLPEDLKSGKAPNLLWITPNLCSDGHDCGATEVDHFLRTYVSRVLASKAFRDRGALFVTSDEGSTDAGCCRYARGGRVETIILGAGVPRGSAIRTAVDHYSLLRTVEDAFRLPHLGHAACSCSRPMLRLK